MKSSAQRLTAALATISIFAAAPAYSGVSETKTAVKQEYTEFKNAMSEKIELLDDKINELQGKVDAEASDGKEMAKEKLKEIKALRSDLGDKLNKLGESAQDEFKDMKVAVENSYNKLKTEVEKRLN